jgi:hypothetical protein
MLLEQVAEIHDGGAIRGTVAKLAMRQPFVLFKGLTFHKNSAYHSTPVDHHNKMLGPPFVGTSPQYL